MSVEEWLLFGALRLDIGRRLKVRFGRFPAAPSTHPLTAEHSPPLLHRHALGQITRLINVGALHQSGVIREQLQGNHVQNG